MRVHRNKQLRFRKLHRRPARLSELCTWTRFSFLLHFLNVFYICVCVCVSHKTGREKLLFKRGWEILLFVLEFCVWPVAGGNCKHGCHGDGWRGSKNISCDLSLRCCVTRSSSKCASCQIEKAENFTVQIKLFSSAEARRGQLQMVRLTFCFRWSPESHLLWPDERPQKNLRSAGLEGGGGVMCWL